MEAVFPYFLCIVFDTILKRKEQNGMAGKKGDKKYVNSVLAWCLLGAEALVICIICLIVFM